MVVSHLCTKFGINSLAGYKENCFYGRPGGRTDARLRTPELCYQLC